MTTGSFTNGRISCTFTRTDMGSNDAEDRDLTVPAFLLIASGAERGMFGALHGLIPVTAAVYMSDVARFARCYIFEIAITFLWIALELAICAL